MVKRSNLTGEGTIKVCAHTKKRARFAPGSHAANNRTCSTPSGIGS